MRSLIILYSYHHNNTRKVAEVIAKVLDAKIKPPQQTFLEEPQKFDLVGFGSGIYGYQLHTSLLELVDKLPEVYDKKTFIFSTSGMTSDDKAAKDHSALKEKLQSKGYRIIGEFQCKGFNTNSFLKLFGGINKGKPDAQDLKHAEEFAFALKFKQ